MITKDIICNCSPKLGCYFGPEHLLGSGNCTREIITNPNNIPKYVNRLQYCHKENSMKIFAMMELNGLGIDWTHSSNTSKNVYTYILHEFEIWSKLKDSIIEMYTDINASVGISDWQ